MYEMAKKLVAAGISVLPVGKGKRPLSAKLPKGADGKPTWKPYQSKRPSVATLESWFDSARGVKPFGIATIGGQVSGGLEIIDFDVKSGLFWYPEWSQVVQGVDGDLFDRLIINSTPSGGMHVRYRVPTMMIPGNQILAKATPKTTLIETRGEGGYALCPPSPGYEMVSGELLNVADISPAERQLLIDVVLSLNLVESGDGESSSRGFAHEAQAASRQSKPDQTKDKTDRSGDRPGDVYNESDDYRHVLEAAGWQVTYRTPERDYWKRPGTENRWSATWNHELRRFYVFTDNASPFEQDRSYNPFGVLALLKFDGDYQAAARSLIDRQRGTKSKSKRTQQRRGSASDSEDGGDHSGGNGITGEDRYSHLRRVADDYFASKRKRSVDEIKGGIASENMKCQPPLSESELEQVYQSARPRLVTSTAVELMRRDLPEPKWAVPDFVPEGLSILAGKPKMKKSFMCLAMGLAISAGGVFLGEIDVEQGEVLYCALEDNERRLQSRMATMLKDAEGGVPTGFHYTVSLPKMDVGGLDLLDVWCDDHPSARLVIIDTLQAFKPHGNKHVNAYEADYDIMGRLQHFFLSRGIAGLVVHHLRKADAGYELDELSGSTGITGAADAIMILKNTVDGVTFHTSGRDVMEETYIVAFEPERCLWYLRGDAESVARSDAQAEVLAALENEALTAKELATALGKNRSTIRGRLQRLVRDGQVCKFGEHYCIPK